MVNDERVINILTKIDILVSIIDKLNTRKRLFKKNSEILNIDYIETIEISGDTFARLSNFIKENLEKQNDIYYKLEQIEKTLEKDFESIKNEIENQIKIIEEIQAEQIYKKIRQLMYVAKWQNLQKEKSYYEVPNTLKDKLTGKAKTKKLLAQNKELKSELVKKEYNETKDEYQGQSIRESVIILRGFPQKNNCIIEYEEKLIKAYMIDDKNLNTKINDNWEIAGLVPTGFFEQRKYYKVLAKNIEIENNELIKKLKEPKEVFEEKPSKIVSKFQKLIEMNKNLSQILQNL